jgi:hypothetical protein
MLKWAAYAVIFGFFIGANNAAHIAGFLAGGALGWFAKPGWPKDPLGKQISLGLEMGCIAVASLGLLLVMVPPKRADQWVAGEPEAVVASSRSALEPVATAPGGVGLETVAYWAVVSPICDDWNHGRRGVAIGHYRDAFDIEPGTVDVQPLLTTQCGEDLPEQRRDCELYWSQGLGAALGGEAAHLSASESTRAGAMWDKLCAAVGVPDPASADDDSARADASDDDSAQAVSWEDLFGGEDDDSAVE